jgi:gas vesicle protein
VRRWTSLALGFSLGAMVGASWVLLFAPQSGVELRRTIRERLQYILEEARQAGAARKAEIATRYPLTQSPPPSSEA